MSAVLLLSSPNNNNVSGLMYPRISPQPQQVSKSKWVLYLLLVAFLLLAPASVSSAAVRDGKSYLKWSRVGLMIITFFYSLRWLRLPRSNMASGKLILLAVIFCAGALWSDRPAWGLMYKGMFVCSVLTGISLANSLSTDAEYRAFFRTMSASTFLAFALVTYFATTQDVPLMQNGRLVLAQLNPNLLGQTTAILALLCLVHLLFLDSLRWMRTAGVGMVLMLLLTVLTGSRAAILMLLAGLCLLLPMLGRQQKQLILLGGLSLGGLFVIGTIWLATPEGEEGTAMMWADTASHSDAYEGLRLTKDLTKDTRLKYWGYVFRRWQRNPALGEGWLHYGNKWGLVQSAYLQILIETGLIGLTALIFFLYSAKRLILESLKCARRSHGASKMLPYIFSATLFGLLIHGVFESSMVTGASPNSLLLTFSTTQLDLIVRRYRLSKKVKRPIQWPPAPQSRRAHQFQSAP